MTDRKHIEEGDQDIVVTADEHLPEATQRRYIAALLVGAAADPGWADATEHLKHCSECTEGALRGARELADSPQWRLLKPGEFARSAQQLWITRLREHARAPMREAAARELGALEPLGPAGYTALVEAALYDTHRDVRAAAQAALAEAHERQPLAARLPDWETAQAAASDHPRALPGEIAGGRG